MASSRRWGKPRRPVPKSAPARVRFLLGSRGKDTKRVADQLGVSERTVRSWLTGKRTPSKANAAKLEKQTSAKYERSARESAKAAGEPYVSSAAGTGGGAGRMRLNGYVTMLGQTSRKYNRPRNIVHPTSADQAARAQAAYQNGDQEGLYQVAREVLADYFNTGGGYNFTPDQLDFDLSAIEFE